MSGGQPKSDSGGLSSWGPGTPEPKTFVRRFRWLIVAGSILVLLLLLVVLAPTLASMGWAKSIILGQVNDQLNGTLEAKEWDLNWWGGIELREVRLFDKHRAQLAEMKRLRTDLSVWDVVFGDYYNLGNTKVEGLDVRFERNKDGSTNFSDLVKKPANAKKNQPETSATFVMPDLKGDFDIEFRGSLTQEDDKGKHTFNVDRSFAKVKVDDINKPLANKLDVTVRTPDGASGKLLAEGKVKAFEKFKVIQERLSADESLELQNFPLALGLPFVPPEKIDRLGGIGNGKLSVKMEGVDDFGLEGATTIDDLIVGGKVIEGDQFAAKKFTVNIPKTVFDRVSKRLKTGGDSAASTPIVIRFDENQIVLAVDAPIAALENLIKNQKPGADGQLSAEADVKIAALAAQLPHMLDLPEGVKIESGNLKQSLNLALSAEKAVIKQVLDLTDLRGTREGKAISAKPIHLTFEGTSLGGGGPVPDLRNFVIGLTSGFGQINGTGESLAKHHVDGTINLKAAKDELEPFSAFLSKAELKGDVQFKLDTTGDLIQRNQNPQMQASLTGRDLFVKNVLAHEIHEDWIEANAKGDLIFDNTVLKAIHGVAATIKTKNPQNPSVDMNVAGDVVLAPFAVPNFEIKPSNIDLKAAQTEFAAFIPSSKFTIPSGTIALAGKGKMEGDSLVLNSLTVKPQKLTLVQDGKTILVDYSGTLEMLGEVKQETKDKKSSIEARLAKLTLTDQQNLLSIEKAGDGELVFSLQPDGSFTGNGKLAIKNADLKKLKDIRDAASGAAPPQPDEPNLQSGNLSGTLELVRARNDQTVVVSDLKADNLTLSGAKDLIRNEKIFLALRANADKSFSTINVNQLDLQSTFMRVLMSETLIQRPVGNAPVSPLDMIDRAQMKLDVPDLNRAYSLVMAFIPDSDKPEVTKPGHAPAPASPRQPRNQDIGNQRISSGPQRQPAATPPAKKHEPIKIAAGVASGTILISHPQKALQVEVQNLSGQRLELTRGNGRFAPRDIALNLALLLRPIEGAAGAKPLSEQIQDVQITKLDGKLGVADIELAEPITLKNLTGNIEASGAIGAKGDIDALADFLEVMGFVDPGTLKDYHGAYTLTQKVGTKQDAISAAGQINITNLKIDDPKGPRFSERLLTVNNELSIDQKSKLININNLALSMQDSKALEVVIKNGKIEDYENARKFDDVKMSLSYDAAKLWAIVKPMLSAEQQKNFEDMRVAGVVKDREFAVTGSYPAEPKKAKNGQPISPLEYTTVSGSLYLNQLEYQGMLAEDVEIPLYFNKGILTTIYKDKPNEYPKPAKYSGGTIDLSGLQIDVLAEHPRVTAMRKNYALLENVQIKREFVDAYLGKASPWFTGAQDARGRMTVMVNELDRLPVDESLTKPKKKEVGKGSVTFSITDLRLKPPAIMATIFRFLKIDVNSDGTIAADIKDAPISVENGRVSSDITLNFGGQPLRNKGTVQLSNDRIVEMSMFIPKGLLSNIPGIADLKLVKDVVEVPVAGDLRRPQIDVPGAVLRQITPGNLLENILQPRGKPSGIIGNQKP